MAYDIKFGYSKICIDNLLLEALNLCHVYVYHYAMMCIDPIDPSSEYFMTWNIH